MSPKQAASLSSTDHAYYIEGDGVSYLFNAMTGQYFYRWGEYDPWHKGTGLINVRMNGWQPACTDFIQGKIRMTHKEAAEQSKWKTSISESNPAFSYDLKEDRFYLRDGEDTSMFSDRQILLGNWLPYTGTTVQPAASLNEFVAKLESEWTEESGYDLETTLCHLKDLFALSEDKPQRDLILDEIIRITSLMHPEDDIDDNSISPDCFAS